MRLIRLQPLWTLLGITAGLCVATALYATGKYVTLSWEAEDAQGVTGKAWMVKPYKVDPSGKVSNKTVLRLPRYAEGEHPPKDEVTFPVNVPEAGTYYLWARTFWAHGCGNSFFIKIGEEKASDIIMGGDGTYNIMHWICLTDGGKNEGRPRPLRLPKGVTTITVGARESVTMIDQFVLTNDRDYTPANIVKPTPNALVKPDDKDKK